MPLNHPQFDQSSAVKKWGKSYLSKIHFQGGTSQKIIQLVGGVKGQKMKPQTPEGPKPLNNLPFDAQAP